MTDISNKSELVVEHSENNPGQEMLSSSTTLLFIFSVTLGKTHKLPEFILVLTKWRFS